MPFEIAARYGPCPVCAVDFIHEPSLILSKEDVGIDDRAAAERAGYEPFHPLERPEVEYPVESLARIPESPFHSMGSPRKRARRIRAPPFQKADPLLPGGKAIRDDRSAEARSDNHCFEVFRIHLSRGMVWSRSTLVQGDRICGARCRCPPRRYYVAGRASVSEQRRETVRYFGGSDPNVSRPVLPCNSGGVGSISACIQK